VRLFRFSNLQSLRAGARLCAAAASLVIVLAVGSNVSAAAISVFNTGVDALKNPLADGAVDPHYTLIASDDASFPGPNALVVNSAPVPLGWLGSSSTSKWIAPQADQSVMGGDSLGSYIYRTTFDLTNLDPASATLTGNWATDNIGVVFLNGNYAGATNLAGPSVYTAFNIASGFTSGINTLDFLVVNNGTSANPTGLRVEISGTANNIPEPATAVLAVLGMLGLCVAGFVRARTGP
jgi:hypothetical protein